jgi:hypothetical protein
MAAGVRDGDSIARDQSCPASVAAGEMAMPAAITARTPMPASMRPNQPVGPAGFGGRLVFRMLMV